MIDSELNTTQAEQELFTSLRKGGLRYEEKQKVKYFLVEKLQLQKSFWIRGLAFLWLRGYSKPAFGLSVMAIMALVGVGVGKASERALPGDVLYTTKTSVYEPVEELFSSEDDLEKAKECIKRRLYEAEILSREGRLEETKKAQIEALIERELLALETEGSGEIREALLRELDNQSQYFSLILDNERKIRIIVPSVKTENKSKTDSLEQGDNKEEKDNEGTSDERKNEEELIDVKGNEQEKELDNEREKEEHAEKEQDHRGNQEIKTKTEEKKTESKQSVSQDKKETEDQDRDEEKSSKDSEEDREEDSDSSGSGHGKN